MDPSTHLPAGPWESLYEPTYDYLHWVQGKTMGTTVKRILPSNASQAGRLRVLMVTPFYGEGGGVGSCAIELAGELRRLGVIVDILHWWPNLTDAAFVTSNGERMPLSSLAELFEADRQYDVLHFQSAAYSDRIYGELTNILQRFPVPVVFTVHCLAAYHGEVMSTMEGMSNTIRDQVEMMERSRRVVMLTQDIVEIAARYHAAYADKFVVIENGTHLPVATPELEATRARLAARLMTRPDGRILLYVGRISPEKGIYELAAALPRIVDEFPEVKLVIAGNKPGDRNMAKIEELWGQQGLEAGVHYDLVGWIDGIEKVALFSLADFVIMPSHYEHMPLTALEAMAQRKPVIINDIESLRGTFFPHDPQQRCVLPMLNIPDPRQIVEALQYTMEHPAEVAEIVERAHRLLTSRFNWPKIAERTIALYQEVCMEQKDEEQARFNIAFEARFQKTFDLAFEGTLAVNLGDHRRGAELLCAAFELSPDNRAIHGHLALALRQRIVELRAELDVHRYDPERIAELQRYAETLRQVLYEPLDARAVAPVTAVMPVFIKDDAKKTGLTYLVEAVDSVLAQDFSPPIELVMVDDCSEVDIGRFLLAQYPKYLSAILGEDGEIIYQAPAGEGRRIRLINKRTNSGNDVAPRNLAIWAALQAGGRYIAHIDSDDRMPPDRISTSLAYLERDQNADMLHGRHRCIDGRGNLVTDSDIDSWYHFARKFTFGMDPADPANAGRSKRHDRPELDILTKENWVHGGTVLYRSNVVLRIGAENMAPTRRYGADHVYWQKISSVATIDYLSHVLTEHRLHNGSMTQFGR